MAVLQWCADADDACTDLTNDKSTDVDYILFAVTNPKKSKPEMVIESKGKGGRAKVAEILSSGTCDAKVISGAFLASAVDERGSSVSVRRKFIHVTYVGGSAGILAKGKVNGWSGSFRDRFPGCAVYLQLIGGDLDDLQEDTLETNLMSCGGAHKPSRYDFTNGTLQGSLGVQNDDNTTAKRAQEEARIRAQAKAAKKKREKAKKLRAQEEEARISTEEENRKKKEEEVAKAREHEELRKAAEEEAKKKREEELEKLRVQQHEARNIAEEEAKKKREEKLEKMRVQQQEGKKAMKEARKKREEGLQKIKAQARKTAEETKKKREEELKKTKEEEEEDHRRGSEKDSARKKAMEEERRKEEEAQKKAEVKKIKLRKKKPKLPPESDLKKEERPNLRSISIDEKGEAEQSELKPKDKDFIMLLSSQSGSNLQIRKMKSSRDILTGIGVEPTIVDGADPTQKETRDSLFQLSGVRGNYPQFFVKERGREVDFFGDYETLEEKQSAGTLAKDIGMSSIDKMKSMEAAPVPAEGKRLILMISSICNPQVKADQNHAKAVIEGLGIADLEVLDGADAANKERRNKLWGISEMRAKYPQLFTIKEDGSTSFVGNYETVIGLHDQGSLMETLGL
jgi:hypothetical protein